MKFNIEEYSKPLYEPPYSDGNNTPFYCSRAFLDNKLAISSPFISHIHWHKNIEIIYVFDGRIGMYSSNKYFIMNTGDFLMIRSQNVHASFLFENEKCQYIIFKFLPDILISFLKGTTDFQYLIPFLFNNEDHNILHIKNDEADLSLISDIMFKLRREYSKKECAFELVIKSYLIIILSYVFRIKYEPLIKQTTKSFDYLFKYDLLNKMICYINENYMNQISSKGVSNYLNMSYSNFAKLFKKIFNSSFTDYLFSVRMKEAEKLILATDLMISEIALKVGFLDVNYFIRQFKRKTGIPPIQYRKKFLNNIISKFYDKQD